MVIASTIKVVCVCLFFLGGGVIAGLSMKVGGEWAEEEQIKLWCSFK